jgi:5,10-methylenetetrahydrofolate reductase
MNPIEISFEFFPPKTPDGVEKLRTTRMQLAQLKPQFVSVTFGAGGSTQQGTLDTVLDMAKDGLEAAPHLSCIGSSKESLRAILERYRSHGIRHIVALRGDLPSGMGEVGELRYASELVSFIRAEHGDWFRIEVAAYPEYHPQARSPRHDRHVDAELARLVDEAQIRIGVVEILRDRGIRTGLDLAREILEIVQRAPVEAKARLKRIEALRAGRVAEDA